MSRKVFTAGEVLAAADVNSFLMDQTVMSFANTAARGSAIPSPTEGMYTHLEDTDRLQFWNGSAWASPLGMTLITDEPFTSTTSLVVEDVFSSDYDAYQIILTVTSALAAGDPALQLRVSGTPASTNYNWVRTQAFGTSTSVTTTSATSSATIGRIETTGGLINLLINNPGNAVSTFAHSTSFDATLVLQHFGMLHSTATAYTGFNISLTTATGNVKVYGLRK
jgi:hypothetical protein